MAKTRDPIPVTGVRITSPTDFCATLGGHSHSVAIWANPRGEREQALHRTLNEMFKDLPFVDALDPESVDEFLSEIESPLENLHRMGYQLFVIRASGESAIPPLLQRAKKQMADWNHNSYIVAPDPSFFWIESHSGPRIVHMLTGACPDALVGLAVQPEPTIHVHHVLKRLSGTLEGEIPWCPLCFLEHTKHAHP